MENIKTMAANIAACSDTARLETLAHIYLSDFATEFARVCKNIRDTSTNEADWLERCERLSKDTGIGIYSIKQLC